MTGPERLGRALRAPPDHADRRDAYDDNPYSHACVMARAQEITPSIVSVGIRSVGVEEREDGAGATIFYAHEMDQGEH